MDEKLARIRHKQSLENCIRKHMLTCFIYSLAEFEKEFGELWGEAKDDETSLTETESLMDQKYERVRKRILDNGNKQIRSLIEIVNKTCTVTNWPEYEYKVRPDKE